MQLRGFNGKRKLPKLSFIMSVMETLEWYPKMEAPEVACLWLPITGRSNSGRGLPLLPACTASVWPYVIQDAGLDGPAGISSEVLCS